MTRISITLAGGQYDRTQALISGEVRPEGIDFNYIPLSVDEIFWRALRYREFEAAEMSMAAYVINRSRGIDDFIAIPAFPSRMFRHSSIYVRAGGAVRGPEDLRGARIGLPEYQMTMAVWVRGFLSSIHGVDPVGVTWFTGGVEETGRNERIELRLPDKYKVVRADKPLSKMLITSEIDALVSAVMPRAFVEQTGEVERLFPDYRKVEIDYYRKTNILPIMHLVVIRKDVLERFPWVATSLFKAYNRSTELALRRMYNTDALPYSLLWLPSYIEEERTVFGQDLSRIWANGVEANRQCLETFIGYCEEQGLLEGKVSVSDLFPASLSEHYSFR